MLVKACLNGTRRPGEHPALPITPEQLAVDATAVQVAGAGAVHVHPRDANGVESLAAPVVGAAVAAIRAACPGLPIGTTTGAWIEPDLASRLDLVARWEVLPDFASVNVAEEGAFDLMALLLDRGVDVEPGFVDEADARALVASGIAGRCVRVLIEVEDADPDAAVARAAAIDTVLDAANVRIPRLYHGVESATWAVVRDARRRGRDVRIGLEDTLVLPDGSPARDNAQLVELVTSS